MIESNSHYSHCGRGAPGKERTHLATTAGESIALCNVPLVAGKYPFAIAPQSLGARPEGADGKPDYRVIVEDLLAGDASSTAREIELGMGIARLHQLHSDHGASVADVAHPVRELLLKLTQLIHESLADFQGTLDQPLLLDHFQDRQSGRAT